MFCRSLFVLLSFPSWPLCCLFFFDILILIAPLVSSNPSSLSLKLHFKKRLGIFCDNSFKYIEIWTFFNGHIGTVRYVIVEFKFHLSDLKKFIFRYQDLVEIYSVSAEKIISDAFSYSENV